MSVTDDDVVGLKVPVDDLETRLNTLLSRYDDVSPAGEPAPVTIATIPVDDAKSMEIRLPAEFKSAKVMIIDDEPLNIEVIQSHLEEVGVHNFVTTDRPQDALQMMRDSRPEVLLLDVRMPRVSGFDILHLMMLDPVLNSIPTIIVTATTDPTDKYKALNLGAYDFLTKPVEPSDLIPRVRNALVFKRQYDQKVRETEELERVVERRTAELQRSRQQLILSLARAAEHRDNDTANHVIRVGRYAEIIARGLGWSHEKAAIIEQAAQLHDVGKIGISDTILLKPGKLDPEEYELMKRHALMGKEIIEPFSESDREVLRTHARLGQNLLNMHNSPMMVMAARIAQTHHERWDGKGYPLGLAGEDIPIEGRITSVADVFDAVSCKRPYKPAFPRKKCFEILEEGRGTQFESQILDAFFANVEEIIEVQLALADNV